MSDVRALDEPLTDAELDELEAFLASDAVPQDCMDLEMLDGYLTAVASGPESIQPSEWLPGVWSEGGRSASPAYGSSEQAQRVMGLMLRHMVGIERTLAESPTRFRPLLYMPDRDKGSAEGECLDREDPVARVRRVVERLPILVAELDTRHVAFAPRGGFGRGAVGAGLAFGAPLVAIGHV